MGWKPEYAASRRAKYQADPVERERRRAQAREPEQNREYMRQYYAEHREDFASYRKRPEVVERRKAARRERYATDEEYREKCKRQARDRDPAVKRDARLRRQYGIGSVEFDALLSAQGNRCAICPAEASDRMGRRLHVDHCHQTGRVRGLLCSACNLGIGKFRDDPELLISAANYLKGSSCQT